MRAFMGLFSLVILVVASLDARAALVMGKGDWKSPIYHCIATEIERVLEPTKYHQLKVTKINWNAVTGYSFVGDIYGSRFRGRLKATHSMIHPYSVEEERTAWNGGAVCFLNNNIEQGTPAFTLRDSSGRPVYNIEGIMPRASEYPAPLKGRREPHQG